MKFPACGWTQPSVSKSSPRTFIVPRPGCLCISQTPWVGTGHPGSRVAACTNRAGETGLRCCGCHESLTPCLVSAVTGVFVNYDVSPLAWPLSLKIP